MEEENLSEALDAVDAKILDLIQHDAGLSVAEIAERRGALRGLRIVEEPAFLRHFTATFAPLA